MRRITALHSAHHPVQSAVSLTPRRRRARLAVVGLCATVGFGLAACSADGEEEVASNNNDAAVEETATDAVPGEEAAPEQEQKEPVFSVVKGDCLQLGDNLSGDITEVDKVECTSEHDAEVYAEMEMTDTTFPGPEVAAEQAQQYCAAEFEPFIGKKGDESALTVNYLHPTQESWDQHEDRKIQCLVVDPAGGVTSTLKDSER